MNKLPFWTRGDCKCAPVSLETFLALTLSSLLPASLVTEASPAPPPPPPPRLLHSSHSHQHTFKAHTHTGARNIIKVLIHRNYGWIFFSPTINSPSRPHFFFLGNLKNLLVLYRWQSREQERFLKRQGEKNQRRGRMNRKGEVRWRYVGDRKTERKREFQVEASGRLWECADVFPNAHYNTCYPDNTHYLLRYGPGTRPYFMTTIFAWSSNRLQTKHTQIYKPFLILLYFSFTLTFQIHSDV